ncbi:MAG: hypothetical protein D8M57_03205 [Candidatus Scalindua sp. AMX11]|nr:MAG: hypothetical protein DWQ00_16785 [Candidatus Scalindua sp.]NOG85874.1 hypothetical protein [Planctomycetota bacterium]RZV96954.1 MAG: hypothetical protein EX341_01865 [Candidatus Scalindua sp. SCAELEC01]TDE66434.1 MAG: hypothetical protein D8M57_03205 [Candidatus Scalindua sp. AMX11]GJQ60186.1 MAG: hypothetical protein SCALA701_29870 [Candidatus Scalindua sp.]
MVMGEKDLEKRNFLNWYFRYATQEEIEKAIIDKNATMERLINEYSVEIEKGNRSRPMGEFVSQPRGVLQEFDLVDCL